MVVAMGPFMRMMEVPAHPVVLVVAMGYGGMAAVRAMCVVGAVAVAIVIWCALVGVLVVGFHLVIIHVIIMGMMKVAGVKVVHVAGVFDLRVLTLRAVFMLVFAVGCTIRHWNESCTRWALRIPGQTGHIALAGNLLPRPS